MSAETTTVRQRRPPRSRPVSISEEVLDNFGLDSGQNSGTNQRAPRVHPGSDLASKKSGVFLCFRFLVAVFTVSLWMSTSLKNWEC